MDCGYVCVCVCVLVIFIHISRHANKKHCSVILYHLTHSTNPSVRLNDLRNGLLVYPVQCFRCDALELELSMGDTVINCIRLKFDNLIHVGRAIDILPMKKRNFFFFFLLRQTQLSTGCAHEDLYTHFRAKFNDRP